MTKLSDKLTSQIRSHGPMRLDGYMEACLFDPEAGYYTTNNPIGQDFITAPEVSSLFGQMIGIWIAKQAQALNCPWTLIELGPGRGTLLHDILKTLEKLKALPTSIRAVEISPSLKKIQHQTLKDFNISWTSTLPSVAATPVIIIANEVLDTCPIRQFRRHKSFIEEAYVEWSKDRGLHLIWTETDISFPLAITHYEKGLYPLFYEVQTLLKKVGGAGLFIDYGYRAGGGHTLQALYRNSPIGILDRPGESDLTAHIDFGHLCLGTDLPHHLSSQRNFLLSQGIVPHTQNILSKDSDPRWVEGLQRLLAPSQMGEIFQVLEVWFKT